MALQREFEVEVDLSVHQMLAELYDGVDWVLVEGFKHSDVLKLEVWRPEAGKAPAYPDDDFVVGIVTNAPDQLPEATLRPVMDLNDPAAVAQWLMDHHDRFHYNRFDEA